MYNKIIAISNLNINLFTRKFITEIIIVLGLGR